LLLRRFTAQITGSILLARRVLSNRDAGALLRRKRSEAGRARR